MSDQHNPLTESQLEEPLTLKSGPPLTDAHKELIKILARASVEDFLKEQEDQA